LPRTLAGISLTIDGLPPLLFYELPGRLGVQAPAAATGPETASIGHGSVPLVCRHRSTVSRPSGSNGGSVKLDPVKSGSADSMAGGGIGHIIAGNRFPPAGFTKQHHARIGNLHTRDRKPGNKTRLPPH
jgi:hypothetical protein